jgi:ferric-dicitrate binding protein FerR (iron transport regulator)
MPDARRDEELPLDELRRAWATAEPPRPDAALDAADASTRAAVAWMQAAWNRVEAPAPVVPLALRARRRGWRRWAQPLAAAAGVLVALGAWLALQRIPGGARPGGVDTETTAQVEGPAPALPDTKVEVAALAPDRVELRSGPVRLILLTGEDSP